MKPTPKKHNGFTLIEIVIVLAIAALIMVIVFLAVAGAQRSRRDTAAKESANFYLASAEQFAGNHGGAYPTVALGAGDGWTRTAPNGNPWTIDVGTTAFTGTVAANTLYARTNSQCGTGANANVMVAATGARNFAVVVPVENGTSYCVDNN